MDTSIKTHAVKDTEQRAALNAWASQNFRGSIIAGTGFGKSRCGVVAINYVLKQIPKGSALLLVPTVQLQDQFKEEFIKWGFEQCLDRVDIICYQSAYKLIDNHYDIVVCDEIHLGLSPQYRKFFKNNQYDRLLCMTATPPEEEEYRLLLFKLAPTVYRISIDECVSLGLVSPYEIHCIPIEMTNEEQTEYKRINRKFVKHKLALGSDAFNTARIILASANSSGEMKAHAAGFYSAIRERKKIVDCATNKVEKFREIVYDNLDNRIITFGGKNSFTDELAASVSPLAEVYHSKRSAKLRKEALRKFKEGEVNVLCSTKALNQGFDVPNANVGVICGLTSKALSMVQRVGRLIRFEEGKKGLVYVLYVKDSQEEKWLKNSVQKLNGVKWL